MSKNRYNFIENAIEVNLLAKQLKRSLNLKTSLYLKLSNFCIFEKFSEDVSEIIEKNPTEDWNDINRVYDFIVGDLPFGLAKSKWRDDNSLENIKIRGNWLLILKSLCLISDNGFGLFLIEPAIGSLDWDNFTKALEKKGFFISAIFNTKENLLQPYTSIQPNLLLISQQEREELFIAELTESKNIEIITENYITDKKGKFLEEGIKVNQSTFRGFNNFKISQQISRLQTQYESYQGYNLQKIALEINSGRYNINFQDKKNSIYIPKLGTSSVVSNLEDAKIKHQNYFQVLLNESIILNDYAALYFSSELGRLTLKSLYTGAVIKKLNKQDLINIIIPIPPLPEQELIINTNTKLNKLEDTISKFQEELSLNPNSVNDIQENIDKILSQLNILSEADKIRSLIRKGESKTLEFKQTLSLDIKKKTKEKYIEASSLKTIVAFLNTEGGNLLIGVTDNSELSGIEHEILKFHNKSEDKFLLHFKNLLKTRIGEDFYPFIDYQIVNIDCLKILKVDCLQTDSPCYLDRKEFYVRTNPSTDKLDGPQLVEYINRHFKK